MPEYLLSAMTLVVAQAADITDAKVREAVYQALKRMWADSLVTIWGVDDILDCAEYHFDEPYTLTEEQAREILKYLWRNQDASIGINWNTVEDSTMGYICRNNIEPTEDQDGDN